MNYIKKYTAIQISERNINDTIEPVFEYGTISGPYYNREFPETEFDTEEEAIEWAYKESDYAKWLILPIIKFTDQ